MNVFPPPERHLKPFPFYAQMRKLYPIVYDDKNDIWGIFRYNDIQTILSDYKHFSSDVQKLANIRQEHQHHHQQHTRLRTSLLTSDPPRHSQLRSVISSAFTPNTVFKLGPRIEEICHNMVDKVIELGQIDLIDDLAYPLPVTVIAELLGIPIQDHDTFKRWADELLGSTRGSTNNLPTDTTSEQIFKKVQNEMDPYFTNIIEKRRGRREMSGS